MFFRRPATRPHEYRVKCNLSRARPFLFRPAFLFLFTRAPSEVCRILFRMLFRNVIQNFSHPTTVSGNMFFAYFPFLSSLSDNFSVTACKFRGTVCLRS